MQIQNPKLLKIPDSDREPAGKFVRRQIQVTESPQIHDPTGDGAVELIPRQIQMLQRGDCPDGWDDTAGEEISREGEILQHSEWIQGGELQFSGEAEAIEGNGDDGAGGVVAGDPEPAGGESVGIEERSVP